MDFIKAKLMAFVASLYTLVLSVKSDWVVMCRDFREATGNPEKARALMYGGMNIGGTMMLGIAMVFISIGFIFLPITTDAAEDLLDYAYSTNGTITDASFTGYTAVVGITPLLILVGFLTAGVVAGMMGIKVIKGGPGGRVDPGSLMLLGLSIVFIGIGLIIEPVMLDGVASVVHGGGTGISTSFTGYSAIILISPMLVHLGFIAAAVLSGFFGLKNLGSGAQY